MHVDVHKIDLLLSIRADIADKVVAIGLGKKVASTQRKPALPPISSDHVVDWRLGQSRNSGSLEFSKDILDE